MIIGHSMTDVERITQIVKGRDVKIYFIGIGGISMSSLAMISLERGAQVFGSDIRRSDATERLERMGARIKYTQARANIMEALPHLAVYSLSISRDNPEYAAAVALGVPLVSRAEYLGALMLDYDMRIGVSGSHGKSTVTAMLGAILDRGGDSPSVLCGAELAGGIGYIRGGMSRLVYEACEYGDSFLRFSPTVQLLLNIDLDHTDYFSDISQLNESFLRLACGAREHTVLNMDDANIKNILPRISANKVTYSASAGADFGYEIFPAECGRYGFRLFGDGERTELTLGIPGRFNAENAVAAAVAAKSIGVGSSAITDALSSFEGIKRRLQHICRREGTDIYYDYAHHPKEIGAVADALFAMGYKNICAFFAPHTYSRTKAFLSEFAEALSRFGAVYVTDIYGAREGAMIGVSSAALADAVRECGGKAYALAGEDDLSHALTVGYDCIVLMGAGDLDRIKKKTEDL